METNNAMDMSLDDIIKTKGSERGGRRGGRGGSRGGVRGGNRGRGGDRGFRGGNSGGAVRRSNNNSNIRQQKSSPYSGRRVANNGGDNGVWEHDLFEEGDDDFEQEDDFEEEEQEQVSHKPVQIGVKVYISNLASTVTEKHLKDIFEGVMSTVVHYDRSGRSKGSGELTFARSNDARDAVSKFNGVEIDGLAINLALLGGSGSNSGSSSGGVSRKPMGSGLTVSKVYEPRQRVNRDSRNREERGFKGDRASSFLRDDSRDNGNGNERSFKPRRGNSDGNFNRNSNRGRSNSGSRGGNGNRGGKASATEEELDAELEAYNRG